LAFVASASFAGEVKSAKLVMGAEAYSALEFGKIIYSKKSDHRKYGGLTIIFYIMVSIGHAQLISK
jgi:hypothetical protein